jgi:hypothetical protein
MAPIARFGGGRRTAATVLVALVGVVATACGSGSGHGVSGPTATTAGRPETGSAASGPPTTPVTTPATTPPTSSPSSAPASAPPTAPPSTARSTPTSLLLSEAANGTTATAAVGATITVVLHSTYWMFAPISPPVLAADGGPTPRPGDGCGATVPGSGCGTVTLVVRAAAPGTGAVSAARTSCGEALRCSPAQSAWAVTIRVT